MDTEKIIYELIGRIEILEKEVSDLKAIQKNDSINCITNEKSSGYDKTKYWFEGKKYGKNRLVLAVVKQFVKDNPDVSAAKLKDVFDSSLQGSLGVIKTEKELRDSYDNEEEAEKRFFSKNKEDTIYTSDGEKCYVCTQWGKANIGAFIERAERLNYEIQVVKSRDY
ncbi:MAG: hypothetical protein IKT04_05565 [Clostridia bacterium]|nr:hypothetical protein [Clostridia bacterium]